MIFLFGIALLSLAMVMSTFFVDSKLAGQLSNFLLYLPTSIYFFALSMHIVNLMKSDEAPFMWLQLGYFMPHFPFGMIMLKILLPGWVFETLNCDITVAWVCLAISIPIYVMLYMYLDAVMPNTFGIRNSCCFCFKRSQIDQEKATEVMLDEVGQASVRIKQLRK